MKKTALLSLVFAIAAWPVLAHSHRIHHHHSIQHHDEGSSNSSHITCEMVRAYVAQMGLAQAKAMAQAAGMTTADEHRARRCLASRV
jgi:hypothetical protein